MQIRLFDSVVHWDKQVVFCNNKTSTIISFIPHERMAPQEKTSGFFLLFTLKTTFQMQSLINRYKQ